MYILSKVTFLWLCYMHVVKEKPKRKTPVDFVPQTAEQWAEYDAPDDAIDAFKTEQMRQIGINASSIPKPVSSH